MKKLSLIFLSISSVFIFSCRDKKDDPTPDEPPVVIPTDTSGVLLVSFFKSVDSIAPFSDTITAALFRDDKQNIQLVNSVSFNGTNLDFEPSDSSYQSYDIKNFSTFNWSVKGKGAIPDFDFNNHTTIPDYLGYDLLPDSIDGSKNLTILISGLKNTTHYILYMYTNTDEVSTEVLDVNANTATVTFSAAELSKLQPGAAHITVGAYNFSPQVLGGKKFIFGNELLIVKSTMIY